MIEEGSILMRHSFRLTQKRMFLELWHSIQHWPSKILALGLYRLMKYFREGKDKELIILTATSGDTGSAVLHGFLGFRYSRHYSLSQWQSQ